MAELPSGLLEACVVIGASSDKLREVYQLHQHGNSKELSLLEAEVLQVHAPPFVSKETSSSQAIGPAFSRVQRRRSFIKKKKRDRPVDDPVNGESAKNAEASSTDDDISVPKDLDLLALPQLCFPGGLQLATEQKEDSYHFLVFTDLFGNRTHGVVVQHHRSVQLSHESSAQNGGIQRRNSLRLYAPFAICIISKFPYYNALRDCLSCLLVQLRLGRQSDFEETVKEVSAKLSLVPLPPPGQLHVSFSLRPLQIVLPSREAQDRPVIDINLHLPLLCFTDAMLLQVLSCLLQEEKVVLFSSDWARLTLVAESLLLYLQPLSWQQPYVPVLAKGMLDFLMAPTAFLMGCHVSHIEEVAAETDDLILVNIDDGSIQTSLAEQMVLPCIPLAAAECFVSRTESLQLHYDLELCHAGAGTDANERRAHRRDWQHRLNTQIQNIALELVLNIFRDVQDYLNYEHRVFNSEEFLRTREPGEQTFYKTVLDTHIFHSFLRDRLNRKIDAYSRMEINTRNSAPRNRVMTDSPRRPPMSELSRSGYSGPEHRLSRRLGASLPNLDQSPADSMKALNSHRLASLRKITPDTGLKFNQKPVKVFRLPEFPPPLAYHYVQNYYQDMVVSLGKAISATPPDDSSLLARYHYLRGLVNTVSNKRLDALEDFQSLYKTDAEIFPPQMVKALVDSLPASERAQAEKRPELKHFISRIKRDQERERSRSDNNDEEGAIKRFKLPKKHMQLEEFVKCVQESGMVKDQRVDPQYMQQALTNALLMDAVVGSLQSNKAIYAASKLSHFDRIRTEVPMMVPQTTAEVLKHKINPSLELTTPHAVDVLLYTPGQLWVSVSGGKVMVFDASTWSITHTCLQVGTARLNCMLEVDSDQVWMGSEDSVIYIITVATMVCNRQLTEHRTEVTGLTLGTDKYSQKVAYSCSAEGNVMLWDLATLQVRKQFRLSCDRLLSVCNHNGGLWCCSRDSIMEVWRNGTLKHRMSLPEQLKGAGTAFSSILLLPELEELWSVCLDSGEVCVWHIKDATRPYHRVELQDCSGCFCMIRVKNQVWIGGVARSSLKGKVYILDAERHLVLKELHGHADRVTALCSAEDRYALSGAGKLDGKVAIWKVE
ncbi:unnamed protein product [Boreogadus saida]